MSPSDAPPVPAPAALRAWLADTDLYWLELVLNGTLRPGYRLLDAGCGMGRNVRYLLAAGFDAYGVDTSAEDIAYLADQHPDRFRHEAIEALSFSDQFFDVVACVAVLHFARDTAHWEAQLRQMVRVLRPGGLLFVRLAVTSPQLVPPPEPLGDRRYRWPGGTTWYLADEPALAAAEATYGLQREAPLKSTLVGQRRCMATWLTRKS